METKDTLSSCSNSKEQQMQPLQDKSKRKLCMDTSSRSGNDAHADDADIRPIFDEEPMAEVQTTAEINVFATRQQRTKQPEFNNKGEVDQNVKQCHDSCPLPAKLTDNQTTEPSNQSLESKNIPLKEGQHGQFSKVKSNEAKVKHDIDVIETINIELEHKVAKLLKENETLEWHYKKLFDSIKTTRAKNIEHTTSLIANNDKFKAQLQEKGFAIAALKNELRKLTGNSVNTKFAKSSILGKPALQPRRNQSVVRQPTAFKSERPRISKQRFASQAHSRSKASENGSKPKPRINNQKSRNWPASKSSCVTTKTVHISEHSRNSRSFSDSKHFVCLTCQKCVFNANHDSCVTKFLNEVNLCAKVLSHKTKTRYKPIEQTSVAKKLESQIPIRHRFSIKKTSVVHEKTITPRSCLRWKPTGKIFKTVGLKWIPTGKIFTSSTTKVDSEPTNGSNDDITNKYECEQTLDVSAGTLNLSAGTSFNPKKEGLRVCSELGIHDHSNEQSSSKLVPKVVPPADKTATSRQELELLFHHHITMLRIWNDEDVHDLITVENKFPDITFNDSLTSGETLSCEPTVSSLNDEIDFRISFDDSDDEDYMVIFNKNSFSYKIIYVNNLKTDSGNDNENVNMPSFPLPEPTVSCFDDLDFFKDFENEFPAIVYNDAQISISDLLTKPILSPQHIDEFDLNDEISLSKYDEKEQKVLYFNDLFPFNIIHTDNLVRKRQ
ncbi:hypothetical protein Tco_0181028 [Tanacetum coccineum]